ncbi:MAG: oligosaccharide flippase family protein [Geminicoccaceae bacterium]|nr:oligosaccharide flippase family protein [Geminicoccaceae bacterium]
MPPRLSRLLPKGRFARRLAALSGATLIAQGLVVASSPVLTRLYSPTEFGVFTVFQAFIGIAGPIMALRFEFAIPVSRGRRAADGVMGIAFATIAAMSILFGLALWLGGTSLLRLGASEALVPYVWLLWLGLTLFGLTLPLIYRTIRDAQFRRNGLSLIGQFGGQTILHLGLGLAGAGALGLIVGYLTGYLIRFAWLATLFSKAGWRRLGVQRLRFLRLLARRHWRYPAFSSFSTLLQGFSQFLPAVFLAAFFGPAAAGWFGLGQRLLTVPVRILGQATSHAFLAEAKGLDRADLYRLFVRTTTRFFLLGLLGGLPLILFSPPLFAFLFGEAWRTAGVMVQVLVPLHLMRFTLVPVSQVLNVLDRQGLDLLISFGITIALLGSFASSGLLGLSIITTVAVYAGASCLAYALGLGLVWYTSRAKANEQAAGASSGR